MKLEELLVGTKWKSSVNWDENLVEWLFNNHQYDYSLDLVDGIINLHPSDLIAYCTRPWYLYRIGAWQTFTRREYTIEEMIELCDKYVAKYGPILGKPYRDVSNYLVNQMEPNTWPKFFDPNMEYVRTDLVELIKVKELKL